MEQVSILVFYKLNMEKMQDNGKEMFPIVDAEGNVVGSMTRSRAHGGSMLLHPVVHLHVFDNSGRLYLQKRPSWKDIQPGKWDTACGGHMDYGESVPVALRREVKEELGIEGFVAQPLAKYVFESARERELVNVFATVYDGEVCPSAAELDGGRYWTVDEILENMGKDVFTPNFEQEFTRVVLPYVKARNA